MAGTMIVGNVTGGMQDQMRFVDGDLNWIDFSADFPSNHRGTYKDCGSWVEPVFPSNISLAGSVPTPYIFDDRCDASDAAGRLHEAWQMSPSERKCRGELGMKWATGDEAGFTSEKMSYRMMDHIDKLFKTWKPREKYTLIKIDKPEPTFVPHKLEY